MVFYFSGTGNSKWVAEQIAERTNDIVCNISELQELPHIDNETKIGFVFPIYAWGVAEPMLDFVKVLPKTNKFTYGVCTCGADAGLAMKKLSNTYKLDSSYSVIMPSNYIVGADLERSDIILEKIKNAKKQVEGISEEILKKERVYKVNEGSFAFVKSNLATIGFNKFARDTKSFAVNDTCISCGLCAMKCPARTIKIVDGKPIWGKKCYQCLKCINNCPKKAIEYGKKTKDRDRYSIDNWC